MAPMNVFVRNKLFIIILKMNPEEEANPTPATDNDEDEGINPNIQTLKDAFGPLHAAIDHSSHGGRLICFLHTLLNNDKFHEEADNFLIILDDVTGQAELPLLMRAAMRLAANDSEPPPS